MRFKYIFVVVSERMLISMKHISGIDLAKSSIIRKMFS